jgi:hypothetical protein
LRIGEMEVYSINVMTMLGYCTRRSSGGEIRGIAGKAHVSLHTLEK